MYHSTAVLLPDGRVLAAGGDCYPSYQIYSPPYLFAGACPTIASAPISAVYALSFEVQTPDSASIQSVVLMRPGSVTHSTNMNQRYVPLTFTPGTGSLEVTAPASRNVAPPGDYMLFLVNGGGVPSEAHMMRIDGPDGCG